MFLVADAAPDIRNPCEGRRTELKSNLYRSPFAFFTPDGAPPAPQNSPLTGNVTFASKVCHLREFPGDVFPFGIPLLQVEFLGGRLDPQRRNGYWFEGAVDDSRHPRPFSLCNGRLYGRSEAIRPWSEK